MVMIHTNTTQKQGKQTVGSKSTVKQTDGQRQTDTTNCSTLPANAVGNQLHGLILLLSTTGLTR